MSFRTRLTLIAAAAVAVTVTVASALVYVVARDQLRGQIDEALVERAEQVRPGRGLAFSLAAPHLGEAAGYAQLVNADGAIWRPPGALIPLPSAGADEVAAGSGDPFFRDATVEDTHVRIFTTMLAPGIAVQIARPLTEVDRTLDRLALLLIVLSIGGTGLAGGIGLLVTRAGIAPVRRLTETAERVTATRDLTSRIDAAGDDELGRLARSFNAMLEALDESARAQRQLVTDASHELRTPLTSLRTNVEVLERMNGADPAERDALLADLRFQLEELTGLVGDVVELSRGSEPERVREIVRLDEIVAEAVERARRHDRGLVWVTHLEPTTVMGVRDRIDRAVANLLDNAAKWSPDGSQVEVEVRYGEVTVRDHGPGIDPADLPRIFDRFYRAPKARAVPGSGLGLAIVRQVAEEHGGAVEAELPPGGGTSMRLRLFASS